MRPDPDLREEYLSAYRDWQKQLAGLHAVLLEGQRTDPARLKGLLNREARAKERYDAARLRLLGLSPDDFSLAPGQEGDAGLP